MKASELIALLNAEIEKYGDLEVRYENESGIELSPYKVSTYNKKGKAPRFQDEAVEIYIH